MAPSFDPSQDFSSPYHVNPSFINSSFSIWQKANMLIVYWILKVVSSSSPEVLFVCIMPLTYRMIWRKGSHEETWFTFPIFRRSLFSNKESWVIEIISPKSWGMNSTFSSHYLLVLVLSSALTNVTEYKTQDQVIKFLKEMNENYLTVRTHILWWIPSHPWVGGLFSCYEARETDFLVINLISPRKWLFIKRKISFVKYDKS